MCSKLALVIRTTMKVYNIILTVFAIIFQYGESSNNIKLRIATFAITYWCDICNKYLNNNFLIIRNSQWICWQQ
uniref:Putative secreted protein n=1 Tax=Xenopsylla cheopis TaxID=163159 RepID=A0A6M2E1Z0_XENCH